MLPLPQKTRFHLKLFWMVLAVSPYRFVHLLKLAGAHLPECWLTMALPTLPEATSPAKEEELAGAITGWMSAETPGNPSFRETWRSLGMRHQGMTPDPQAIQPMSVTAAGVADGWIVRLMAILRWQDI